MNFVRWRLTGSLIVALLLLLAVAGCSSATRINHDGGPDGDADGDVDGDVDGDGDSDTCGELETLPLDSELVADESVRALDCAEETVAWSGTDTIVVRSAPGSESWSILGLTSSVVALDRSGRWLWYVHPDSGGTNWLVRTETETHDGPFDGIQLPETTEVVNAMIVDPRPDHGHDVYIGTDSGTVILDGSDRSCGETIGCWVGLPSTGYVHAPPSLAGTPNSSVEHLARSTDGDERAQIYIANATWAALLSRGPGSMDIMQSPIDFFDDREPQATTALAWGDDVLWAGVRGLGLVRSDRDGDCAVATDGPVTCPPGQLPGCSEPALLPHPLDIVDLAYHNGQLFIASDAELFLFTPSANLAQRIVTLGDPVEGQPTAVAACDAFLYVGTARGLWRLQLPYD